MGNFQMRCKSHGGSSITVLSSHFSPCCRSQLSAVCCNYCLCWPETGFHSETSFHALASPREGPWANSLQSSRTGRENVTSHLPRSMSSPTPVLYHIPFPVLGSPRLSLLFKLVITSTFAKAGHSNAPTLLDEKPPRSYLPWLAMYCHAMMTLLALALRSCQWCKGFFLGCCTIILQEGKVQLEGSQLLC